MKDLIKLYYNIDVNNIEETEKGYEFDYKDSHFLLYLLNRNLDELKDIYQVCEELKVKNILVHTFIQNKDNKIVTTLFDQQYILLKVETSSQIELNVIDMINFTNQLQLSQPKSKLYRNNWSELWSQKIDYFEYQVRELGKDKKVVLNSFSYYIGLAENAISYANNTNQKYKITYLDKITLCHKRIDFPNLYKSYMNPLNFIFDLEVRDVAEYLKSIFFESEEDAWIELKAFLKLRKLSIYGYQMFYARLLYPSYYFDTYERIMNKKEKEESLLKYIKKAPAYEQFLKKIMLEINQLQPIEKVEWILNKKTL